MRVFILVIGLLAGISKLNAQTNFGIAYYQVPAGWQVVQQSPNIILEEQRKDGKTCRIIISATEEVVVNKENVFLSHRQQKSNGGFSYSNAGTFVRNENDYGISFASHTTELIKNKTLKSSFYSFTNNVQSFFVQLLSEDDACDTVLSHFLKALEMEEASIDNKERSAVKTKKYKAGGKPRGRPRKIPI